MRHLVRNFALLALLLPALAWAQSGPATFGFLRVITDLSKAQPIACLAFSQKLDAADATHYADYVTLTPRADARFRVQGDALCIDGLALGRSYKAVLARGLPAADGTRLASVAAATIDFGDKPKMVQFAGQGFILTRDAPGGVTVDTVNVDEVAIEVLRINDRLAPGMIRQLRREAPSYRWGLQNLADERARAVWSGTLETKGAHNEVVHTGFPLASAVPPGQPGIYVVVAANTQGLKPRDRDHPLLWQRSEDDDFAAQFVVQTDIALTSVSAADGLHVFARSLATAAPIAGLALELQARDSAPLGTAATDAVGQAVFPPGLLRGAGAAAASMVAAHGAAGDYALLDLTQPAFDLSDRGVTGRDAAGPLDAFVYTDRGIYRPGEEIHAVALLRDRVGQAVADGGLTLVLRKPNGVAYRRIAQGPQAAGGFRQDFDLPEGASRGHWRIEAEDADAKVVGSADIEVQDFVPQRLKVAVRTAATLLHPKDKLDVAIDGRFLYGAPAGGLGAEGHVTVEADPAPFPQSAQGFRFGLPGDAFKPKEIDLDAQNADADGHATASGVLDVAAPPNVALKATVTAGLQEPGGRVTSDTLTLKLRTAPMMLGIRPRFGDDRVGMDEETGFELIAVDEQGHPVDAKLHWVLIDQTPRYDWYLQNGRWRFHRTLSNKVIDSGDLAATAARPAVLTRKFDWGEYLLAVEGPDKLLASYHFRAGWMATAGAADTPDKVDVTVEQGRYRPGATARLRIVPPFAGKVRLMLARDRVFDVRELDVPREGVTVDVPVGADWGAGAYALASLYRPADGGRGHLPIRAIGLAWIGVDPGAGQLGLSLKLPAKIEPRQKISIPIAVTGAQAGDQVYVTLAAVDEGILQLTRFKTPDPAAYYFGQRRLAVDIRDDYGRLLDGTAPSGQIRSGGDALGGKGLPVVPTRSVALFEGPLRLGADNTVAVPLDVPDFEGELRVMAVAFSAKGVGKAEGPLTVRDPVVPDVALPRFLAPGDAGRLAVLLDNRDGPAGDYHFALAIDGAATLPGVKPWDVALAAGERKIATFPIAGSSEGIAKVTATLTGPGGINIVRDWSISVRGAHYPITLESVALQPKGEPYALDPHLLDAFVPGSVTAQLSYSRLAGIDVPGLLQSLWRYPYGCTEQLASTALPLLYYDDPALGAGAADKPAVHARVQSAIDRILDRQDPDGSFGLWRAGDGLGSDWLSLYALDFLVHARAAGFEVPEGAITRGYDFAEGITRNDGDAEGHADTAAYAAWLLAPAHRIDLGRLRQLHDGLQSRATLVAWGDSKEAADALAVAQLGGALAVLGDRARGANAMRLALAHVERPVTVDWWQRVIYWSRLRDAAGLLAIAAESDQLPQVQSLVPRLQQLSRTPERLTTQEKAWLLVAAHAVTAGEAPLALTVNGQPFAGAHGQAALAPTPRQIVAGIAVTPTQDLWRTLVVHGSPKVAPAAMEEGLSLKKRYFAMDGGQLDPAHLPQNRRFVVVLEGRADDSSQHRVALVDLLPAGWEIEAVLRPAQSPDFVGPVTRLRLSEGRDDRLVAAFDLGKNSYDISDDEDDDAKKADQAANDGRFRVAYVARAVTLGHFTLPEAVVEDMYRPGVMARTAAGTAEVTEH